MKGQEADQDLTEDLNSGLSRNKSYLWKSGGFEPGTSVFQHQRPKPLGHAACDHLINSTLFMKW